MDVLYIILTVFQVTIAIALVASVLLQHGKGADAGTAFGSGSSATVFGSQGSTSFLTKATAILAVLFLVNSLSLAILAKQQATQEEPISVLDKDTSAVDLPPVTTEPSTDQDIPDVPIDY